MRLGGHLALGLGPHPSSHLCGVPVESAGPLMLEPSEIKRWERQLRAMLRAGADNDPEGLATVVELVTQAYKALPFMVELARAEYGYSWADIAAAMPITRQAAHERFAISSACFSPPEGQTQAEFLGQLLALAIKSSEV